MSFFSDIFGGVSNNFNANPNNVQVTGQNLQPQINTGNANYAAANQGLQGLTGALQAQMGGQGPNLAQAQLNQATNQNIQQGAGMIKSQAGISPALATRNIADQTAAANQGAAGQAAVTRLQSQLGAQGQLGQTLGTQGSLANQNVGIAQNAQAAQNNVAANLAGIGAGQAQQNAAMNQGLLGGLGTSLLGLSGSGGGGGGGAGAVAMVAKGGEIPSYANGGQSQSPFGGGWGGQGSSWGPGMSQGLTQFLSGMSSSAPPPVQINPATVGAAGNGLSENLLNAPGGNTGMASVAANGGQAGNLPVLPFGPQTMAPMGSHGFATGGPINGELYAAQGRPVPGQAKVAGDSLKNDTVPAMLSPKEIILPRSVTLSDNAPQKAAEFVAHIKAKDGGGDFREALGRSIAGRRKK